MKQKLTAEERKIIYNAVKYYQMYRTALESTEYQICDDILTRWFDQIYTQQKEQVR